MMTVAKQKERVFAGEEPTWCPGCGHYLTLDALKRACTGLGLKPEEIVLVSGIGNAGKISSYFNSYGMHVSHGRTLPVATVVKLSNRELTVLAAGGDGDGYAIGTNHLVHAIRRNVDITYLAMNNRVYALTAGQTSPTSNRGFETKTTPRGAYAEPLHPPGLAMGLGATFVAREFVGRRDKLSSLIQRGVEHEGFAFIDILSPCVIFNHLNTYQWYRENTVELGEDHDPSDREAAVNVAMDFSILHTGLIYQGDGGRVSLEESIPGLPEIPVAQEGLELSDSDFKSIMEQFA